MSKVVSMLLVLIYASRQILVPLMEIVECVHFRSRVLIGQPSIMDFQKMILQCWRKTLTGADYGIISVNTVIGTKGDQIRLFRGYL